MNTLHSPNHVGAPEDKPETLLNLRVARLRERFGINPDLALIIAPLVFGEVSR